MQVECWEEWTNLHGANEDLFVSIITSVYNAELYLHECIESVLNQTSDAWELLLIDDGSTDRSGEICDYYANIDERVSVIHKKNTGQFDSRCQGIRQAKGMYCTCLDADDYLENNCVSVIKKAVENHPCDILCWNIRRVHEGKTLFNCSMERYGEYTKKEFLEYISRTANHSFCNKLIRTDIIKQSYYGDVPDSRRSVDYIQICPSVCMSNTIYAIDDVLYNYRQVESSVTHRINGSHIIDILNSTKCIFEIVAHYGMFDQGFEKAEYVCLINTIGYDIKHAYKRHSISREEAEIIRKHPVFRIIRKYEKCRYSSIDLIVVLKMFRFRQYAVLSRIYGR